MTIFESRNIETKDLFQKFSLIIDEVYNEFDYVELTKAEYYKLVLKEIDEIKKMILDKKTFEETLVIKLKRIFIFYTEKQLFNNPFELLNKYINQKLNISIENLNKLGSFLTLVNYYPSSDLINNLLKSNKKLNKILALTSGQKIITNSNNNEVILKFINAYSKNGKIELEVTKNKYSNDEGLDVFYKTVGYKAVLPIEEERKVLKRIKEGDLEARKDFIERNLKMVVYLAKYYGKRETSISYLIQEGTIGLIVAIDKFDINKNVKFSTYARWWITRYIVDARDHDKEILNMSIAIVKQKKMLKKVKASLKLKLNREPTIAEIAEEIGFSIEKTENLSYLCKKPISLNFVDEITENEFGSTIMDKYDFLDDVIQKDLRKRLLKKLYDVNLKSNEIEALTLRFGFYEDPLTFEGIGSKLNLSSERARQLVENALTKLRINREIEEFAVYLDNPNKCLESLHDYRSQYVKKLKSKKKVFL